MTSEIDLRGADIAAWAWVVFIIAFAVALWVPILYRRIEVILSSNQPPGKTPSEIIQQGEMKC